MSKQDGILHLPIKTEWLDMISAGIKTEEYRDMTPRYKKMLLGDDCDYDIVKFHNYGHSLPVIADFLGVHIGKGKEEWGAVKDVEYYVITLDNAYIDLPF